MRLECEERRWKKDLKEIQSRIGEVYLAIGADLCYTVDATVIENLAETVREVRSEVVLMAFYLEHNPQSVRLFKELIEVSWEFETPVKEVGPFDDEWPREMREDADGAFVILEMHCK